MDKFNQLTGIAAPLPLINVDTDKIIPKQFLKTIKRTGLGVHLFDEMRYDDNGGERASSSSIKSPTGTRRSLSPTRILAAALRGSTPTQALLDFGIRCVIAPSFADIFFNNCFKNGILPIRLPREIVNLLMEDAKMGANARLSVNLEEQVIIRPNGERIPFDVDAFRKHCLLNGLDDIGLTLEQGTAIDGFEAKRRASQPWLDRA